MAAVGDGTDGVPLCGAHVEELRAQLRCADPELRAVAVRRLRAWRGRPLGPGAVEQVLRAATVAYPWVAAVGDDVGELLVQLLWSAPGEVDPRKVQHTYPLCAERARRALLHLLALRGDAEALEVVGQLLDLDGHWDLLPVPTEDLLTPLLEAPGVERLAQPLVLVAWRRGWSPHVADLLTGMLRRGLLDEEASRAVAGGLAPLVEGLLDTCNRCTAVPPARGDLSRVDRRRLAALLPVFTRLGAAGGEPHPVLRRALASADPRVAALAVLEMARSGAIVADERVALVARDPEARAVLVAGLAALGRQFALPAAVSDERSLAEAEMVRWLASETQLGVAPDEVEHRGCVAAPPQWGQGVLHVFAFRVRPPHWSAERGWMLAAVGPYDPSAELHPRAGEGFAAFSLYLSEDGGTLGAHVLAMAEALAADLPGEAA
jgi:hypothetical protein